jgi:hypothetical protein
MVASARLCPASELLYQYNRETGEPVAVQGIKMATGSRVHSRKGGTAHRSGDAETNDVTATLPTGAKLDKSGLYDQQQVKRLLDDQLVAVRIQLQ